MKYEDAVSNQEQIKNKKLVQVELSEEVWKIISKTLNSDVRYLHELNLKHPNLWRAQDEITEALKQAVDTINKALSEQRS